MVGWVDFPSNRLTWMIIARSMSCLYQVFLTKVKMIRYVLSRVSVCFLFLFFFFSYFVYYYFQGQRSNTADSSNIIEARYSPDIGLPVSLIASESVHAATTVCIYLVIPFFSLIHSPFSFFFFRQRLLPRPILYRLLRPVCCLVSCEPLRHLANRLYLMYSALLPEPLCKKTSWVCLLGVSPIIFQHLSDHLHCLIRANISCVKYVDVNSLMTSILEHIVYFINSHFSLVGINYVPFLYLFTQSSH